jgi:hypothetical protein
MGHGFEAGYPIAELQPPARWVKLREKALEVRGWQASANGDQAENGHSEDERRQHMERALQLANEWVADNTQRLAALLDSEAATGLLEIPLLKVREFFDWLLAHEGLNGDHLGDYQGSMRIQQALQRELSSALEVPVRAGCLAFYANLNV